MIVNRDYFDNPIVPDYVLAKANKERIGVIKCTDKTSDIKYNNLNTVSFTTYLYVDNEKNPCYEDIDIMKYILLPNIGFYYISDCKIHSEGTEFEYKEVTATSYEGLMGQKYIESFVINMGNIESIDGVQFYNIADKSKSLLHLVLEKCPGWKLGHIDPALVTMQRSFEIDKKDVYSFIMNDVAPAFECVFLFDTLTNTINIYQENNMGEDTDIHVSYNNLLESTDISCSIDDIKTSLTITGVDDLTVREINMGYDNIINLDFYNSTYYMSQGLYDAYNKWVKLRSDNLDQYTSLLSQYQNYYKQINYLTYEKMPNDPESTDWTLYGLNPLIEKLTVYEQKQAVSMKAGHGNTDSNYYQSEYLPIYNTIIAINAQIEKVKKELNTLKSSQDTIYEQMSVIIDLVAMENNFTEEQLIELNTFIREDELNTDNFVVTDVMTDDERFDMLHQMLDFGKEELSKASTPQLSFGVNMANIFSIPNFSKIYEKFDVGNYIWITFRDDYNVKARLLTIHINYHDTEDFSVTFGNILRKAKTRYADISAKINAGVSAATSVSFNQSNWNKASKDTDNINQMLADGLLSQGNYIATSTDNSDFLIDQRGLFVNTTTGIYANKDSIFIGGGRILFTDDAWKTVAMAVGRADVNGESRFGVFADFCIASYIAGSTIEGGTITGTVFNNGNGTFLVDENGKLTANSATIKGTIQATDGWFGGENGFKIETGKAYTNNKNSINSTNSGVYLGNNGIALGANSPFKVDEFGNLTAKSGIIGGIKVNENKLYSTNGNFELNNNGQLITKYITLTGVQPGSSFGSIGFNGSNTWGNFSGNSYFGSNVPAPFIGTTVTHIQSISADYIYANYIETIEADIGSLNADVAVVQGDITSINGDINVLNGSINAAKADIRTIKSNMITTDYLGSNTVHIHAAIFYDSDYINYHGSVMTWKTKTINGTTITYLGQD